jgi:hypothetical protein
VLNGLAVTATGAAGGYGAAEGNTRGQAGAKPISSDVGGNTVDPGGIDPDEPDKVSTSDDSLDLSGANKPLQRFADKYGSTSGQCHKCADGMARALQRSGYDVDIVKLKYDPRFSGTSGNMFTADGRQIASNGWHEAVRIRQAGSSDVFIDAEVYLKYGPRAIPFDKYSRLYLEGDAWKIVSTRVP